MDGLMGWPRDLGSVRVIATEVDEEAEMLSVEFRSSRSDDMGPLDRKGLVVASLDHEDGIVG